MTRYIIAKADFERRMGLPPDATILSATEEGDEVVLELGNLQPPCDVQHYGGTVSVGVPHDWIQWVPNKGDQLITLWDDRRVIECSPPLALDWED